MKNLLLTLLLFVSSVNIVYAEGTPLACIKEEVGGLMFKEGKWKTVPFNFTPHFILILDKNGLITAKSAGKLLSGSDQMYRSYRCGKDGTDLYCTRASASYSLNLHQEKLTGTMIKASANLTYVNENDRDTMSITAFSCQKF